MADGRCGQQNGSRAVLRVHNPACTSRITQVYAPYLCCVFLCVFKLFFVSLIVFKVSDFVDCVSCVVSVLAQLFLPLFWFLALFAPAVPIG